MLSTYFAAFLLAASGTQAEEGQHCPAQPLPPPPTLLAPVSEATNAITFSAVPSLEYPRGAWVVRLSRLGFDGPANIEIARLRAQSDCNRYDIVGEWSGSMPSEDFEALAKQVMTVSLPATELFGPGDPLDRILGLDGTSISIQMDSGSWKISGDLRGVGSRHETVSSIFHTLVAKVVPTSDLPTEQWRMPPRADGS
jgi:hypothetical protein